MLTKFFDMVNLGIHNYMYIFDNQLTLDGNMRDMSGVARPGHTGARALATGGRALPLNFANY